MIVIPNPVNKGRVLINARVGVRDLTLQTIKHR
jgi:hypothetical protein